MSRGQTYRANALPLSVISSICLILYLPFFVYALIKWKEHKQHYIIKKRFPAISYAIITLNVLNAIAITSVFWTHVYIDAPYTVLASLQANAMCVYGLINVRLFLVYQRWKQNLQISAEPQHIQTETKSLYYHWFTIVLILLAVIGPIISVIGVENDMNHMIWTLYLLITITLICILICKKVKEGIAVKKETIIVLCFVLISGTTPLLGKTVIPALMFVGMLMQTLTPNVINIITLYIPLYYIHKLESNVIDTSEQELRQASLSSSSDITSVKKEGKLFQFLTKHENYIVFRNYVVYCWALEHLLFVQQTQILRRVILKYCNDIEEIPSLRSVHSMGFEYLKDIYSYFEARINKVIDGQTDNIKFDQIRDVLYELNKEIYDKFIEIGAEEMINISWDTRRCLSSLFEMNNVDKFVNLEDFVNLYDSAGLEVYRLIASMYQFRFRQYINKQ